jgi:hypothetical protein
MADNRNNTVDANISDDTVQKVGVALGQVTQIREEYTKRLALVETDDEKEAVASEAQDVMIQAVSEQGLSVGQFNTVISAAEEDAELGQRVLAASKAA